MLPTINDSDHSDLPVEELNSELSFQWIDGGRILVSRLKSSRKAVYDEWEAWMRRLLDQWSVERSLCLLQDIRSAQFTITLYMGTQLRQFNQAYQHLHAHTAIIYTNRFFSSTVVTAIQLLRNPDTHDREFFTDYDQGIRWLQDQLNGTPTPPIIVEGSAKKENIG